MESAQSGTCGWHWLLCALGGRDMMALNVNITVLYDTHVSNVVSLYTPCYKIDF